MERTIFRYKNLEVKVLKEADDDIVSLLSATIMGGEGGMQYTMCNVAQKLKAYGDRIRIVSLVRNISLAAVIGVCYRSCDLHGETHRSSFLRFLAFRQSYRASRLSRPPIKHEREHQEEDTFRRKALKLFSEPHLLGFPGVSENDRHIMYAYVESRNERTKSIIQEAGYEYIRSFLTVAFSRFHPKASDLVGQAKCEEFQEIREQLKSFYSDYSFYFDDYHFGGNRYFVLREEGRIIAGVSAIPTEYNVINVPGVWGWIMMKVLPFAPQYRKLFNPGLFRFISLGSIFYLSGREDALAPLFESVCAISGCNTALTWVDDRGPLFETLRTRVDMGTLNRLLNAKPGLIYARFRGYNDAEKEKFYDAPVFISGIDFS